MLSRDSLSRVLRSLLSSTLKESRGRKAEWDVSYDLRRNWSDDLLISGSGDNSLGCDSLERLWLASAANEMFHLYEAKCETELLAAKTFGCWIDVILAAWQNQVDKVTFTTSGSTGIPKRCTHSFSFLRTEADFLASCFKSCTRLVAFTPAHHIYGFLFTGMLADILGIKVFSAESDSLAELAKEIKTGDLIVSIPSRWQALDRTISVWPKGVMGIVSTSPCPEDLIASLMKRGLGEMTEVYGASETGGVGLRRWPQPRFQLMPQWRRSASEPLDDTALCHTSGDVYRLQDHIIFQTSNFFRLEGRLDGAVQVGGVNVYPHRVASLLSSRPGVLQAEVRLMRADEGFRLKALIVPVPEAREKELRLELESWIDNCLTVAERPRSLTFINALPMMQTGMEIDW